tara:strand:- start:35 stop:862 length:828 start_codon:yes stop_codon:yes gene_type:complete
MIDYQVVKTSGSNLVYHFIAGNGFSPAAYKGLFEHLPDVCIQSPLLRPLWSRKMPLELSSWDVFVDDLEEYLVTFKPKIVLGHSIGASIWLLAAKKFNYHFDKIILIEPVIFPKYYSWIYVMLKGFNIHKRVHPMISKTLKRKRVFDSKQSIIQRYSQKELFSRFDTQTLSDYVDANFIEKDNGYELIYSPEWEAEIYDKMTLSIGPIWDALSVIQTDICLFKAEFSNVITKGVYKKLVSNFESIDCIEVKDTSHLLPFETPSYLGQKICDFNKI